MGCSITGDSTKPSPNSAIVSQPARDRRKSIEWLTTSTENILDVYKVDDKVLGMGHFGSVRLCSLHKDPSIKYVVKTIPKEKILKDLHVVKRELELLRSLSHPNIIKFYETYNDAKFFHIVMEYCSGGDLFERISRSGHLSEEEAAFTMRKVFLGVSYLHDQSVCHRDIKPENLLYSKNSDDAEIKIIDFGLSRKFGESEVLTTMVGSPMYVAPEVISGKYNHLCDNWSLGVTLYILLLGKPPFFANSKIELLKLIAKGEWTWPAAAANLSDQAKDLITKLLVVDVGKRITSKQALNHPWFALSEKKQGDTHELSDDVITQLKSYSHTKRFKREALKVVLRMLDEKEIKRLRDAFRLIDTGNTGTITVPELTQAMKDLGYKETEHQISDLVNDMAYQGKQEINYTEFIAAMINEKRILTKEKLWAVFQHFDTDSTSFITKENLVQAMARSGRKLQDEDLNEMMKEIETKHEGKISFEEFCQMMMDDRAETIKPPR